MFLKREGPRRVRFDRNLDGEVAFELYDTYGFPLDLTELMARERGIEGGCRRFEQLMEQQRERARKAQKKEEISVEEGELKAEPTKFLGYDFLETALTFSCRTGKRQKIGRNKYRLSIVSPFYAEMGGQVGDHGWIDVPRT